MDKNIKDNEGKPPMHLIAKMYPALAEVAKLSEFGNTKYMPDSWVTANIPESEWMSALMRHTMQAASGEVKDPEHGLDHLAAVAWNALAMLTRRIESKAQLEECISIYINDAGKSSLQCSSNPSDFDGCFRKINDDVRGYDS